jgi:hypothetical protein
MANLSLAATTARSVSFFATHYGCRDPARRKKMSENK